MKERNQERLFNLSSVIHANVKFFHVGAFCQSQRLYEPFKPITADMLA